MDASPDKCFLTVSRLFAIFTQLTQTYLIGRWNGELSLASQLISFSYAAVSATYAVVILSIFVMALQRWLLLVGT